MQYILPSITTSYTVVDTSSIRIVFYTPSFASHEYKILIFEVNISRDNILTWWTLRINILVNGFQVCRSNGNITITTVEFMKTMSWWAPRESTLRLVHLNRDTITFYRWFFVFRSFSYWNALVKYNLRIAPTWPRDLDWSFFLFFLSSPWNSVFTFRYVGVFLSASVTRVTLGNKPFIERTSKNKSRSRKIARAARRVVSCRTYPRTTLKTLICLEKIK